MSYSYDLRQRAVRYVEEGGRITMAARLFGVHRQTVQGWVLRRCSWRTAFIPRWICWRGSTRSPVGMIDYD